eukprot:6205552-Pleurochrysis_carterae.AAC.9
MQAEVERVQPPSEQPRALGAATDIAIAPAGPPLLHPTPNARPRLSVEHSIRADEGLERSGAGEVALVVVCQRERVQDPPVPVLHVDARQVLAAARDQLDANAIVTQRVGRHVVDKVLEQLVVVLVVDGRADMAHHLVRGQVAVGDVRVDRVVQQHLRSARELDEWVASG